ncbi:hypothetical protein GOODEAATRI_032197, partial [Goodea atripinnis]
KINAIKCFKALAKGSNNEDGFDRITWYIRLSCMRMPVHQQRDSERLQEEDGGAQHFSESQAGRMRLWTFSAVLLSLFGSGMEPQLSFPTHPGISKQTSQPDRGRNQT